ncbi:MAG: chromatin modification- protein VID21 [Bathelium mastoideum]|nr:MAG: chromatin modification- protein VID21 [Bathelium mastoideum]KAI9693822.1 MAG: chromatin modification- protein VID21 [Bathelium mastoideum]
MSLDAIRDGLLRTKKNELTACEDSRKRKLRELYAVTSDLRPEQYFSLSLDAAYAAAEHRFLNDNDITKGHYFQESTLPIPSRWTKSSIRKSPGAVARASRSPAARSPQPRPGSLSGTVSSSAAFSQDVSTKQAAVNQAEVTSPEPNCNLDLQPSQASPGSTAPAVQESVETHTARQVNDSLGIDPQSAVPPSSEDVAALPDNVNIRPPSEDALNAPRTIHLPPKEEQEQHLEEIEQAQENARQREKKEDAKLLTTTASLTMDDMPSSPSSTAGPFSVNTPMPHHHSPDTSPDEDNPADAASLRTPISMGPTKQERSEKEEHDRTQILQQEIARQEARGESTVTADAQLRLEEQQAVQQSRDGAQLALGAHTVPNDSSLTEKASDLVKDVVAADQENKDMNTNVQVIELEASQSKPGEDVSNATSQVSVSKSESTPGQFIQTTVPKPEEDSASKTPSATQQSAIDTSLVDAPMPDAPSSPDVGSEEASPHKRPPPTPCQPAPRSTTRLSSGAIRHKSVSEILGETPKPATPSTEKPPTIPNYTGQPLTSSPVTATPITPGVLATLSNNQMRTGDRKDKDRSKLSAVVFAKPDNSGVVPVQGEYSQLAGVSQDARKDYFQTMFVSQAYSPPRAQHLSELLGSASKVLTTSNRSAEFRENLDNRVLRRVYQLQNANKWSLRQLERASEPPRPTTHLDYLLREMKWMRTDFREERKWKIATARNLAHWCAQWVMADKDQRLDLQVRLRAPQDSTPTALDLSSTPANDGNPGKSENALLEAADVLEEDEAAAEVVRADLSTQSTVAPAAVFSLGFEDSVFMLPETELGKKLVSELPSFSEPLDRLTPKALESNSSASILPVSKYVRGRVVAMSTGPPRKRSRYEYEPENDAVFEGSEYPKLEEGSSPSPNRRTAHDLPPEQNDVALFYSDNKLLRERLHAGQAFRPPSEFPMPPTSFYETRTSSHWLWDEDQKLRALVKDYTYNWSLISDSLSMSSANISSSERRTPWECFERWVQLEGLPAEMSKMQYFRTYQARLDAAQRTTMAQQQAQQQMLAQQGNAAGLQTPLRRRTTVPIRVERRRSTKYLSIVDAMRKLARKREALAHKQQEAAKAALLRKHHEAPPPKSGVHTPQEFSNLKHEQEVKLQKRQEMYRQQMIATQRQAALQQRAAQQGNVQPNASNGVGPQQRSSSNATSSGANLAPPPNPHSQQAINMQRQQMIQQGMQNNMPNGNLGVPNMGTQGMSQAPMQMHMQGHQRVPSHQSPENMRAMLARQAQQNSYQTPNASQYQLPQNNPTQLAAAHMMPANSGIQNQQMLAAAMQSASQNAHANGSPVNGMTNTTDNSGSPQRNRSINPSQQPQTLSSGHVPAINELTQRLKNQNPNMSDQDVQRLAMEQLKEKMASQKYHQQRQNALNAAVGASGAPFAHQQAQQALQSSQNQAAAQQQQHLPQPGPSTPSLQNTHAHTQNTTNGMAWNSPASSHPQPHGHTHGHHPPSSSHGHTPSQGHAQSPPMPHHSTPHPSATPSNTSSANLNAYQQQLSQQLNTQQRSLLLHQQQQQQQQQQNRALHSASPAPVPAMPSLNPGMPTLAASSSPAPAMHAGLGSPVPAMSTVAAGGSGGSAGGMLRPTSAGPDVVSMSRSGTPMQRPGTAGGNE